MQSNVPHLAGRHRGRSHRIAEEGLIDVDEPRTLLVEETVEVRVFKSGVAHFDRQRIGREGGKQLLHVLANLWSVARAPRKLYQHCAQAVGLGEGIEKVPK